MADQRRYLPGLAAVLLLMGTGMVSGCSQPGTPDTTAEALPTEVTPPARSFYFADAVQPGASDT